MKNRIIIIIIAILLLIAAIGITLFLILRSPEYTLSTTSPLTEVTIGNQTIPVSATELSAEISNDNDLIALSYLTNLENLTLSGAD